MKYMAALGSVGPEDTFSFYGPFDTQEAAQTYSEDNFDGNWDIIPLMGPSPHKGNLILAVGVLIGLSFVGPFETEKAAEKFISENGLDDAVWQLLTLEM